ncbi:RING-H2 finger protein ATL80-like [Primulina eburnea]|uniref:RING-H2 finger protein ATL80-like n=1 Tax=Primulina eburnea TaxID=1245227 RepID=UPI003C6C9823
MRGNDQGSSLVSHHPSWFIQVTGLPRLTIESIGEVRYKRGEALRDCCICLSEFEEEERLRVLTKCGHAFHVACIDTWLMSHMNCPVCRAPILSADDDVSRNNSQQEISELLQVENMVNEEDTIDHDFADKMGIRRSVSVGYLHGSSIQTQQVKRSSSFTGN